MKFKAPTFFLILLILLSLIFHHAKVPAQEKKIYTLEESIAEALDRNWSLKATEEKIEQAIHVKYQARADFLPKLITTYGYQRLSEVPTFRSSLGGNIAVSSQDNYQWKGTVTQPIFTGFALISNYKLAELGIDQSETEIELKKLDLALEVKEAYFNILIADKAVEVAEKEVESLASNVNVASSFYKVGIIPINDLLKAEVELANARQNLVKAQNGAKLVRSGFNTVLSRPVNAPVNVEDILNFKPEGVSFDGLIEQAFENRPEMKLVDISLFSTDQEINLAKSKNYPEVSLNYDYIREGDNPDVSGSIFHDSSRWEATAVFSWTLWEWGKTHYSIKEKESLKKELIQTKLALEDNIRLELKDAILALETAEENIPTTKKSVEQGEENMRVNEERYRAQVTTITEVLDAQTLLTRARVNYYRALYGHNLAKARLQRALGTY